MQRTLIIPDDVDRGIAAAARQTGAEVEEYLVELAKQDIAQKSPAEQKRYPISVEAFDALCEGMKNDPAFSGKILPASFSRADLYDDHD